MQPVIALMLSEISAKGDNLSELLVGFVMSKVDEGKSSDIEVDLNEFSSELFKEGVYDYFNKNKLSLKNYIDVKNNFSNKFKELEHEIKQLSHKVRHCFSKNNLTKDDLLAIVGTGKNNRITKIDVLKFVKLKKNDLVASVNKKFSIINFPLSVWVTSG